MPMYFASLSPQELTSIIAMFVGFAGAVWIFLEKVLRQATYDRKIFSEQSSEDRKTFTEQISKLLEQTSIERRALITGGSADRENERTERLAAIRAIENNNKAYEKISTVIQKLEKSIEDKDIEQLRILKKISDKQDTMADTIKTTNMTVENLFVLHEKKIEKERK